MPSTCATTHALARGQTGRFLQMRAGGRFWCAPVVGGRDMDKTPGLTRIGFRRNNRERSFLGCSLRHFQLKMPQGTGGNGRNQHTYVCDCCASKTDNKRYHIKQHEGREQTIRVTPRNRPTSSGRALFFVLCRCAVLPLFLMASTPPRTRPWRCLCAVVPGLPVSCASPFARPRTSLLAKTPD